MLDLNGEHTYKDRPISDYVIPIFSIETQVLINGTFIANYEHF